MTTELKIEGMSCNMCVGHVTTALQGLDGVASAKVSLDEKLAVVDYDAAKVTVEQMIAAVDDEGYSATRKV
ncbi:MAG TPA: cation transporter [Capsulimonadaceae bacterium]|jgi:copper chaperone